MLNGMRRAAAAGGWQRWLEVGGLSGRVAYRGLFFWQYLSPYPVIRKIVKQNTTGNFSYIPYLANFLNATLTTVYGFLLRDNFIMLINRSSFYVSPRDARRVWSSVAICQRKRVTCSRALVDAVSESRSRARTSSCTKDTTPGDIRC